MKKNLIVFLFMAIFILPCQAQLKKEALKIYKDDGLRLPTYLTLKLFDDAYEMYCVSSGSGVIGTYELNGDTITLTPKFYNYGSKVLPVETEVTATSVPVVFIKKDKRLIDITSHAIYPELADFAVYRCKYEFHQIK